VEWPYWDDLHGFWSELPNYNPVGVSMSTAGQDFGAHAVALFAMSSNNKEDRDHASDVQSNYGSGIPDLNCVDPGLETLSHDWNLDLSERSFTAVEDSGDGSGGNLADGSGGSPADGSEDNSKEIKVHFYFIPANHGHDM